MIALGQGGQALDVDSEDAAEGVGLRLAQLGELRSDVLDRAVALAQLEADDDVVADRAGAGSVALGAKGVDERRGPCGRLVAGTVDLGGAALLECADPLVGEGTHRLVARGLAHEAHGVGRQIVVVGGQVVVTDLTDDPLTSRATATALARVRGAAVVGADGFDQQRRRPLLRRQCRPCASRRLTPSRPPARCSIRASTAASVSPDWAAGFACFPHAAWTASALAASADHCTNRLLVCIAHLRGKPGVSKR